MIQVDLPNITLTNDTTADPRLVDLEGWYDGSDSKNQWEERPQSHGSWDPGKPLFSGQPYVVRGEASITDTVALFTLRDQVMRIRQQTERFTMTVTDPLGSRSATVRLMPGQRPTFGLVDERGVAVFAIPLLAPDPLKYGPVEVVSNTLPTSGTGMEFPAVFPADFGTPGNDGRVITTNGGEADTLSMLEVTGGLDVGFSLICVETGDELRFERPVPLGSTVFLNPRTGACYLDIPANDVSGYLTRRSWWSVPAGASRTVQFSSLGPSTGTPTFTARTAPAYH